MKSQFSHPCDFLHPTEKQNSKMQISEATQPSWLLCPPVPCSKATTKEEDAGQKKVPQNLTRRADGAKAHTTGQTAGQGSMPQAVVTRTIWDAGTATHPVLQEEQWCVNPTGQQRGDTW